MGANPQFSPLRQDLRFLFHPSIQTNETITHRLKINEQYLYYQPDNIRHTFQYLSKQYEMYTGQPLRLSNHQISFQQDKLVGQISITQQIEIEMESILNKLQKGLQINVINKHLQSNIKINRIRNLHNQNSKTIKLTINNYGQIQILTYHLARKITYQQFEDDIYRELKKIEKNISTKQSSHQKSNIPRWSSSVKKEQITSRSVMLQIPNRTDYIANRKYIEIYNDQHSLITNKNSKKSVYQQINQQATVLFHTGECNFMPKSQLLVYKQGAFCQIPLQNIVQNKNDYRIASLNIKDRQITKSFNFQFKKCSKNDQGIQVIRLSSRYSPTKNILIHNNQLVLDSTFNWRKASMLDQKMQIYGVSNDKEQPELILFKIVSIQAYKQQNGFDTISISSPEFLNLIIDGIVVHNQNNIKILCNQIYKTIPKRYQINVFSDYKFGAYFEENQECYYAGHKLQKTQTFGDYHLRDKDTLYILKDRQIDFAQTTISIRSSQTQTLNITINQNNLQQIYPTLISKYLGVCNNRILSFSWQELEKIQKQNKIIHIVGEKNGYLSKLHFLQNILPNYNQLHKVKLLQQFLQNYKSLKLSFEKSYSNYLVQMNKIILGTQIFSKQDYFPIYLYTSNQIYADLNLFHRKQYQKDPRSNSSYRKWIPLTNWIIKSLQMLPNYEGVCYRGIRNAKLQDMFALNQNNQTISFDSFNSTSLSRERASIFSSPNGIILQIISKTGKQITNLSKFPRQKQVLFSPFTNFLITQHNPQSCPQTATFEEIPTAKSKQANLLFWVDDHPQHNRWMHKKIKNIQIIEVTSTKIMVAIIKRFFKIYKILGKKMVLITDMVREEYGINNQKAGIELLKIIYNQYGLTIRSYIYTSYEFLQETNAKIKHHNLHPHNINLIGDKYQLIETINRVFQQK